MKKSVALQWSALAMCLAAGSVAFAADWTSAGRDLKNSRYQADETAITTKTVGRLTLRWSAATAGDVTANPAVDGDYLYFPDSAGYLYKLRRDNGATVWKRPISDYTGIAGDFARATPAVAGDLLILGNQSGKFLGPALGQPNPQAARVFAVNKNTGAPVWATQIDDTPLSFVTHSAVVANGMVFVGTASNEELVSAFVPKSYWQWQFRGSVSALDVATGKFKWKSYMVPEGYSGGAVWGSTGAIDLKSNQFFVATGNNYMVPEEALKCIREGGSAVSCTDPANHFDSIVALDLSTGAINWASRGLDSDTWSVACGLNVPGAFVVAPGPFFPGVYDNCPNANPATAGPDYDFAQGPMWLGGGLVGAGQKSGRFWAFDHKTGALAWATQVTPGGVTGGLQWGSATDGRRIFVAAANSGPSTNGGGAGAMPWTLKDGTTTTAGGWAALDRKTGEVLWTTKDPQGSRAEAAVSATDGVVFGCNVSAAGTMYALNARTGAVLWSHDSGGPCNAGPSIADGMVFWGTGTFNGFGPKKVFAFGL
jgi:polyvinyl alcohol dehydrogenase (cytochrome)